MAWSNDLLSFSCRCGCCIWLRIRMRMRMWREAGGRGGAGTWQWNLAAAASSWQLAAWRRHCLSCLWHTLQSAVFRQLRCQAPSWPGHSIASSRGFATDLASCIFLKIFLFSFPLFVSIFSSLFVSWRATCKLQGESPGLPSCVPAVSLSEGLLRLSTWRIPCRILPGKGVICLGKQLGVG